MSLRDYLNAVRKRNVDVAIAFKDYKKSILNFYGNLNAYSWKVNLSGGIRESFDGERFSQEGSASLNFGKLIYNGGVYPLLRKELEIVSYLEREKLLSAQRLVELAAVSSYASKFYHQQLESFMREQLSERKRFLLSFKEMYGKGVNVSRYDFLTERREVLSLEEELLKEKAAHQKADIEFRMLAKLYTQKPIKVLPFKVNYVVSADELEKKALLQSHVLNADRYRIKLSALAHEAERRKGKPSLKFSGNLGISGTQSPKFNYSFGVKLTYPLFEGKDRKRRLLIERLNLLKNRLLLRKHSEEIAKKILSLYEDYKLYKREEEILEEILTIDEERLKIAKEKYVKGIGDYISIRDSWNNLIATKKKLLLVKVMRNKILLDILLMAGEEIR